MTLNQYNEIYKSRLRHIKELYNIPFTPINTPKTECTIFGVLFMSSDLKNTIFDDLKYYKDVEKGSFYYSKDVKWFLEDEHDRILLNNVPNEFITTGMVLAVEGSHDVTGGSFDVKRIIYPSLNVHKKQKKENTNGDGSKLLIVSNLLLDVDTNLGKLRILHDTIKQYKVSNLVILGSILSKKSEILNYKGRIDDFFEKLDCKITIVPGQTDPTCSLYPQEPIHKRILDYKNLYNPDSMLVNEKAILLTSGYNILDMVKYKRNNFDNLQEGDDEYRMHLKNDQVSDIKDVKIAYADNLLDAMEMVLKCKLTCPTAPDTLKAFSAGSERFFINQHYEVFVCGLGTEFKCREYEDTLMIVTPDFSKLSSCVLLDTESKQVKTINIK